MATALYSLFALYVAVTAIFIIMENRRPQATFAWMLLFVSFPGIGVLVYFLFGRDRRPFSREQKLRRQDLLDDLSRLLSHLRSQHEDALGEMEAERGVGPALARLVRHASHSALTTQNQAEILQNADEAYPRLFEDIKNALSTAEQIQATGAE